MLYAIVSDIHGNYNAWAAVLEDARAIGVGRIVCLGDVVGYGPEPGRCVQSIRDVAHACVLGNHDAVITKKLDSIAFNDHARKLIEWTELQLNPEEIDYLNQLDYDFSEDCFRCVHGDCDAPHEFNYIVDCDDAKLTWERTSEQIIFCGHSHIPAVFVATNNYEEMCALPPQDFSLEDSNRYIVNVGSVGSPRDDDLRASYVLFDSETKSVFFRRVCYNFDEFRARVKFVGLNENDVPLLCYVLEEEPADHITLEEEISKAEIVVTNEASDLAKTVHLHEIDLSDILKNANAPTLGNIKGNASSVKNSKKLKIFIKKENNQTAKETKNFKEASKAEAPTLLHHKPGARTNKAVLTEKNNSHSNNSKNKSGPTLESKYLRHVNAAERAPAKLYIFIAVLVLIIIVFASVFYTSAFPNQGHVVRYPNENLTIVKTHDKSELENLLPEIWMSSENHNTIAPYRLTTSDKVIVSFDNIDGIYGAELILQNVENQFHQICFESPYIEIDPKGKYLILAKVFFEHDNIDGDLTMQLVHSDDSNLYSALPSEKITKFYKKEISKKLYKTKDIPKCFKYRPSSAGWWLAQRTVEGKELNKYMRVIVRGNFKGRISIGGISIQRID